MGILENQYTISTDLQDVDFAKLFTFLSYRSYWSKGISRDKLKKAINNSLPFSIIRNETKEFVGFGRVISDSATFAYLADVYVEENYRGKGLAKFLIEYIMNYPQLQGLRNWFLYTKDAHELYERFGWSIMGAALHKRAMVYRPYNSI